MPKKKLEKFGRKESRKEAEKKAKSLKKVITACQEQSCKGRDESWANVDHHRTNQDGITPN